MPRSYDNVALFDMDMSLADYLTALKRDLKKLRMPGEPVIDNLYRAEKLYKPLAARMRLIKAQPGWWLKLRPIPEGIRVLRAAQKMGFGCTVLTKGPHGHPDAWAEKVKWCRKHLGKDVEVTITEHKGNHYGKVLYDDFPPYIKDWLKHRPRGLVIMPDNEYNRDFNHPQVIRWTGQNWDEVVHALKCAFDRKPGQPLILP